MREGKGVGVRKAMVVAVERGCEEGGVRLLGGGEGRGGGKRVDQEAGEDARGRRYCAGPTLPDTGAGTDRGACEDSEKG